VSTPRMQSLILSTGLPNITVCTPRPWQVMLWWGFASNVALLAVSSVLAADVDMQEEIILLLLTLLCTVIL
jgi:hypothetical protein